MPGGGLTHDVVFDSNRVGGVPYVLGSALAVNAAHTLTVAPGTTVKMPAGGYLNVTNGATLIAQGTGSQPITFTANSTSTAVGQWQYIFGQASARIRMSHCDIGYAGGTQNIGLWIGGGDTVIDQCTVHDVLGTALYLDGAGINPVISNTRLLSGTIDGLAQSTADMAPTYSNVLMAGNGNNRVYMPGTGLLRNVVFDSNRVGGVPYVFGSAVILGSSVSVGTGHTLTVMPGTTLKMDSGSNFVVNSGATLIAEGTTSQPITFTINSTSTAPGQWAVFQANASAMVRLSHCDLAYAGGAYGMGLYLQSSDAHVQYCKFHDIAGLDVFVDSSAQPTLRNNQFLGPANGLSSPGSAVVDARFNWWGNITGPHHPTLNPNALGTTVSDFVNFEPWLVDPTSGAMPDLSVSTVSAPAVANPGAVIAVSYTVDNLGAAIVLTNPWRDAIYASSDAVYDLDDLLLGYITHTGTFSGGASYQNTAILELPIFLEEGPLHILVVADSNNKTLDTHRENNVGSKAVHVVVPALPLNGSASGNLPVAGAVYKLQPNCTEGTRITLSSTDGGAQLFVRSLLMPTPTTYDAQGAAVFVGRTCAVQYIYIAGSVTGAPYTVAAQTVPQGLVFISSFSPTTRTIGSSNSSSKRARSGARCSRLRFGPRRFLPATGRCFRRAWRRFRWNACFGKARTFPIRPSSAPSCAT